MGNRKSVKSKPRARKRPKTTVEVRVIRAPVLPPFDRVLDPAMLSVATSLITAGEHTAEAYRQLALASVEHQRALTTLAQLMRIRQGSASELTIEHRLIEDGYSQHHHGPHTEKV